MPFCPIGSEEKEESIRAHCFTLWAAKSHPEDNRLTEASSEMAWILAWAKKKRSHTRKHKNCFLGLAEILITDFDNKDRILKQIKGLQFSGSTIMWRMEDIGKGCAWPFDGWSGCQTLFQCHSGWKHRCHWCCWTCVWVRLPKENSFQGEMWCFLPLHGQTRAEDILNALLVFFEDSHLSWSKLASVCTDGSPSTWCKDNGLISLMEKEMKFII